MNTACPHCQSVVTVDPSQAGSTIACPRCGGQYQVPWGAPPPAPTYPQASYGGHDPVKEFAGKKIAAGICGILLGGFGVHKFILGFNGAGAIMLSVYLVGIITGMCLFVPIIASIAIGIIGLVEGIIYLTKSDEEFYQTYAVERKEWF